MVCLDIPIRYDWSQEEIVIVAEFFDVIARVVEQGVDASTIRTHYKEFKTVVPSKAEEKQLFKEVDDQLGISCFKIIKMANENDGKIKG
nr:UPF0223 family protein [Shouchella xiaoxiensis]